MAETGAKRRNTDWDAVKRDYSTGKFTQQELGAKYGVSHAAVGKKVRDGGWTKDLQAEIKQATNARLAQELVAKEVAKGCKEVADTVLVAAEANTKLVLGHRKRIADLHELVDGAKAKLIDLGGSLSDVREAAVYVQAVGNLANTTKTLIGEERKAFGLDDEERPGDSYEDMLVAVGRGGQS